MRLSHPTPPTPCRPAFSLVELLVVISLIALISAAAIPAFTSMMRAGRLAAAGKQVMDEFNYARQTAISKNVPVEVRLYKMPPHNETTGAPTVFRGIQVFEISSLGEAPSAKPQYFPAPVIIADSTVHSGMLALPQVTPTQSVGDYKASTLKYIAFRYHPSGSTSLSKSNNFLTLQLERDQGLSQGTNFVTVQVNPITGTIRSFRP